jgi:8-oxo-dGTP pyrophosphatase MutT (NUDIX family)
MTDNEKGKILSESFLELWQGLWIDVNNIKQKFKDEYIKSEKKYLFLKEGGKINEFYDKTKGSFSETEWEFPKGRRNDHEKNIECAIREIKEETGLVSNKDYIIYNNVYPLVDSYKSFNQVNYKHVFYIGRIINKEILHSIKVDKGNIHQIKEINDLSFLTKDECIEQIRDYDNNKVDLIKQVFYFTESFEDNFTEIKI